MQLIHGLIFLSGAYPLWLAWRGNRRTTLLQALNWCAAAWLAWLGAAALGGPNAEAGRRETLRYLALCVTGCAGVAVLGARRPGVGAWNFVLLGLLAVMLLPLAHSLLLGGQAFDVVRLLFLAITLAVGIFNYLPTRLGPGALVLAVGCGWEVTALSGRVTALSASLFEPGWLCVALGPWLGLLGWRLGPPPRSEFDRLWLEFRTRFGVVWGQRLREQFNNAAAHAGWPVRLTWQGLVQLVGGAALGPQEQEEMLNTLRALLRRFGPDEAAPAEEGRPPPKA
jgi:hypothetical protein